MKQKKKGWTIVEKEPSRREWVFKTEREAEDYRKTLSDSEDYKTIIMEWEE